MQHNKYHHIITFSSISVLNVTEKQVLSSSFWSFIKTSCWKAKYFKSNTWCEKWLVCCSAFFSTLFQLINSLWSRSIASLSKLARKEAREAHIDLFAGKPSVCPHCDSPPAVTVMDHLLTASFTGELLWIIATDGRVCWTLKHID